MSRRARPTVLAALLAAAVTHHAAAAQDPTELSKKSQSPVSILTQVPFQFSFYSGGAFKTQSETELRIQPVLPLRINARWAVVARPVIPILNSPGSSGGRTVGLGNIEPQIYFTPAAHPVRWGVGPAASFPTATNQSSVTGQWGLGPAGVITLYRGPWVVGLLANNLWKVGGSDQGPALDTLTLQPLVHFNFPEGWALLSTPLWTANWSNRKGDRWTMPLGIGISKVQTIGAQSTLLSLHYYRDVVYASGSGANQVWLQLSLLFPDEARRPREHR